MHERGILKTSGVLLLALSCGAVLAAQGTLPKALDAKAKKQECNIGLSSDAASIVKALNELHVVKIGLDPTFAKKGIQCSFDGRNMIGAADLVATQLKAKSWVIRDFLYIGKETLPPGIVPANGDGKTSGAPGALAQLKVVFPGVKPGSFRTYPWIASKPEDVKDDGRPLVLYVHDPAMADKNETAQYFEAVVLDEPDTRAALEGFQFVLTTTTDKNWPAGVLNYATGGAALFLLTSKLQPKGSWNHKSPKFPSAVFARAALQCKAANGPVVKKEPKQVAENKDEPGKNKLPFLDDKDKPATPEKKKVPKKKEPEFEDEE